MTIQKIIYFPFAMTIFLLSGCSVLPSVPFAQAIGNNEVVIGGRQPVANSTIQLYAVGTTGNDAPATPLLTKTIVTDANGNFNITGLYSCTDATEVYMTAVGGDPLPGVTNENLALMTAIGPCASLTSATPIVLNELTTIAAVNALAPYMTSYAAVGSSSSDIGDLQSAFILANQLVNPSTGVSPGFNVPTGFTVPSGKINTLGDALATCVGSGGGTAGDSGACGSFFALTTPADTASPTNTISALLNLAKNPDLNTNPLYGLASVNTSFQPQLSSAPSNFLIVLEPAATYGSLQLSPTNINFSTTPIGSTQTQNVTLTNSTENAVSISNIALAGANSTAFLQTNECPSVLLAGTTCIIQITFAPQSTGTSDATLQINGGLFIVQLSGSSSPAAPLAGTLQFSPTSINFPTTALGSMSQAQNVTLTNNTSSAVLISNISMAGANSVDFTETNECPSTLAPGAYCTIQTTFSPQSTVTSSAILQINGGAISVPLSGPSDSPAWPVTLVAANPLVYLNFNDSTTNFMDQVSGLTFSSASDAITDRQLGFDSTQPNNTSAAFAWNGWSAAPNDTIGNIDWDIPWTMLIQVDRLNWNRTGTLVLASKGDISSTSNSWWELTLGMQGGNSQLCFTRNSAGTQNGICTTNIDVMPNGFNYNIVVEDNGSGEVGISGSGISSALTVYVNGLQVQSGANPQLPGGAFSNSYAYGFGYVNLTVSGGTGYANQTAFTSTGGGPSCNVTGFMFANNGVPYNGNWTGTGSSNYGCTSPPTIILTSPAGTGATISATLGDTSMDSKTSPLMVPGYVSNGAYYGIAGATTTQNPTYVDEFAIFPGNLNQTQVQSLFYETKFYQGLAKAMPTSAPVMIFDDDAGGDMDNFFALQMAIALQQHGYFNLVGAVIEDQSVTCEATWRQMLDQAGLASVPLSVPSAFFSNSGTSFCTAANVDTYDSSTPQSNAAWELSTTMYRTIFAKYPTTPIDIVLGGPFTAMAEFMKSPADSVSSLTGLELMAQNAANGGVIYAQGLGCSATSLPATTPCAGAFTGDNSLDDWVSGQYVVANNGTTPIYWMGGVPQNAGPGIFSTRTSKDPLYLLAQSVGSDVRQCYDCLAVEAATSSYFFGGVQIAYSGGEGYANATYFTSTGGGLSCSVQGIMTASNGVPNGIEFEWGASTAGSYTGIGWGCTSAPKINLIGATGFGVTLTAYPTTVCGTYAITGDGSGTVKSATCSNHYFAPYSVFASESPGPSGAPMSWFINSLVDPTP